MIVVTHQITLPHTFLSNSLVLSYLANSPLFQWFPFQLLCSIARRRAKPSLWVTLFGSVRFVSRCLGNPINRCEGGRPLYRPRRGGGKLDHPIRPGVIFAPASLLRENGGGCHHVFTIRSRDWRASRHRVRYKKPHDDGVPVPIHSPCRFSLLYPFSFCSICLLLRTRSTNCLLCGLSVFYSFDSYFIVCCVVFCWTRQKRSQTIVSFCHGKHLCDFSAVLENDVRFLNLFRRDRFLKTSKKTKKKHDQLCRKMETDIVREFRRIHESAW